jgi:transposase
MLNGILWILRTGAPWRDLPERYGPWQTVYDYFRNWRADGTFNSILQRLQLRLDREGKIDWDLWFVDGSSVRAARCAGGARKKSGRSESPRTTPWAAREADSPASSIW